MPRKTVEDCLKEGSFRDETGKRREFLSSRFKGAIYDISNDAREVNPSSTVLIGFRCYNPYLAMPGGGITLSELLGDVEATEEDNQRLKQIEAQTWKEMSWEKRREQVQFAYDMGADVPQEDVGAYNIITA
jgi:hypothetical protein